MARIDRASSYPPRGLSRGDAAMYLGLKPQVFDELVRDGRLPPPIKLDDAEVFDRLKLEHAFDRLSGGDDLNPFIRRT
jgi:hypothetical protein